MYPSYPDEGNFAYTSVALLWRYVFRLLTKVVLVSSRCTCQLNSWLLWLWSATPYLENFCLSFKMYLYMYCFERHCLSVSMYILLYGEDRN